MAACGRDTLAHRTDSAAGAIAKQDSAIIAAPATPYQVVAISTSGKIVGTVVLKGNAPVDTSIAIATGQDVCGDSMRVPVVTRTGEGIQDAIVWLEDIRSGKALPEVKRWNVTQERCVLDPRVQGVTTGGTLNVRNRDDTIHRLRFVRQGSAELLAVVGQSDAGQVVPLDTALNRVGLIETHCELHPLSQAWIAVFDQPYYAVSDAKGSFTLDSIPPGTYTLAVWQPRLGKSEMKIEVKSGETVSERVEMVGR